MNSAHVAKLQELLAGRPVFGVGLEQMPAFFRAATHQGFGLCAQTGAAEPFFAVISVTVEAGGTVEVRAKKGLLVSRVFNLKISPGVGSEEAYFEW